EEESGDTLAVVDASAPAAPSLRHPLLARLLDATGAAPRAKLGWTDVSFFAENGIPATNYGPGDPTLAHTAGERVERAAPEAGRPAVDAVPARVTRVGGAVVAGGCVESGRGGIPATAWAISSRPCPKVLSLPAAPMSLAVERSRSTVCWGVSPRDRSTAAAPA